MFEIGNSLREARLRQGLDLPRIEEATPRSAGSTCERSKRSSSRCCPETRTSRASCARTRTIWASRASSTWTSTTRASPPRRSSRSPSRPRRGGAAGRSSRTSSSSRSPAIVAVTVLVVVGLREARLRIRRTSRRSSGDDPGRRRPSRRQPARRPRRRRGAEARPPRAARPHGGAGRLLGPGADRRRQRQAPLGGHRRAGPDAAVRQVPAALARPRRAREPRREAERPPPWRLADERSSIIVVTAQDVRTLSTAG